MRRLEAGQAGVEAVERNVDLVGAAVMACDCLLGPGTRNKIVMMGCFQKKSRRDVRNKYKKSDPPSSHLCPYPGW